MSNDNATRRPEQFYEPVPIAPVFVDGLSAMRAVGAVTHLIFTAAQPAGSGTEPSAQIECVVQARLIVPTDQLLAIAAALRAGHIGPLVATDENGEPATLN